MELAQAQINLDALLGYSVVAASPDGNYSVSNGCESGQAAFSNSANSTNDKLMNCPFGKDAWVVHSDNTERETPDTRPQLWLSLNAATMVLVCFDTQFQFWSKPGWVDAEGRSVVVMAGVSLHVGTVEWVCWQKSLEPGRVLLLGNRAARSPGGATYIIFLQPLERSLLLRLPMMVAGSGCCRFDGLDNNTQSHPGLTSDECTEWCAADPSCVAAHSDDLICQCSIGSGTDIMSDSSCTGYTCWKKGTSNTLRS